jgi:hypothetical protein
MESNNQAPQAAPVVITPTVGRVMWYRPSKYDTANGMLQYSNGTPAPEPMMAQVIYPWSASVCNVLVTDHAGQQHVRGSCQVRQEGDPVPVDHEGNARSYVEWMPYQTSQARKNA